jgi:Concanavalin A-like lectin/glucanases superfamily/IPT/TIG domain
MNNKQLFTLRLKLPMLSLIGICVLSASLLISCKEDKEDTAATPAPSIISFTPAHGLPESTLTITGTNFSSTLGENSVKINGTEATLLSATTTELVVLVPETATGKVSVTRDNKLATSTADFEVLLDFPRVGLIGFWPFTGDGLEKGLNNLSHTFSLESTSNPSLVTDRFGNTNQALNFNGIQSTSIGQTITNQPWTISVWIDPGIFDNPTMGFMESNSGNRYLVFNFANNTSGDFYISAYGDDGTEEAHGNFYSLVASALNRYIPYPSVNDIWMNIIMTFDGSVFKIYKDNVEVYTNTVTTQTPTPNIFMLGKTHNTYYYIGKMDDLIIYNRVLTAAERTQVLEQTVSKY